MGTNLALGSSENILNPLLSKSDPSSPIINSNETISDNNSNTFQETQNINHVGEFSGCLLNRIVTDDINNNNFNQRNLNRGNCNYYTSINFIDNRKFINNFINNYNYNICYPLTNNNNHFNTENPGNFFNSNTKTINIINININKIPNINSNNDSNIYNYFSDIKYKQIEEFTNYVQSIPMPLSEFLCTKKGTQEIKKFLHKSNIQLTLKIIDILNKDGLKKVMINNQGNYLMQKIIKNSKVIVTNVIIKYISEDIIKISNNHFGNYVIQKIIEKIHSSPDGKTLFLNTIKNKEMELVFNGYGTHVLKKILLVMSDNDRPDLNRAIINNILDIIKVVYGTDILKYFIVTCSIKQNKKLILEKIKQNFLTVVQSPSGIYIIKFLFEIWGGIENLKGITDEVINYVDNISFMKFLSFVIDKIITIINDNDKQILITRIFFIDLKKYLNNKYGFKILYKIVKTLDFFLRLKLKYFLVECLKSETYNNEEKNQITNVISHIE